MDPRGAPVDEGDRARVDEVRVRWLEGSSGSVRRGLELDKLAREGTEWLAGGFCVDDASLVLLSPLTLSLVLGLREISFSHYTYLHLHPLLHPLVPSARHRRLRQQTRRKKEVASKSVPPLIILGSRLSLVPDAALHSSSKAHLPYRRALFFPSELYEPKAGRKISRLRSLRFVSREGSPSRRTLEHRPTYRQEGTISS